MQEVLSMITPSKEEKEKITELSKIIVSELEKNLPHCEIIIGGSVGKETNLSGNHDIDIFVAFPKDNQISNQLEKAITWNYERIPGSRSYFQIHLQGYLVELVPILAITDANKQKNITDMSPFHVSWVKKHSTPKLQQEIRLAKAFCKACRVYGAESYQQGFSGYVIELLVIHSKGFIQFLKNILTWEDKKIINPGRLSEIGLNKAKLHSPIIVRDPTDPERNAAAALSYEQFERLKKKASAFLEDQNKSYFTKKEISYSKLRRKKGTLVFIEALPLKKKKDIAGAKAKKLFVHLKRALKEFGIQEEGFDFSENVKLWFRLEINKLPRIIHLHGPPSEMEIQVRAFKEKHKDAILKENIWTATKRREMTDLKQIISKIIKEEKEKIQKVITCQISQ